MQLVIGNKKYSSWSLRPWLALTHAGIAFEEVLIGLDLPDTAANIARYTPSGRVPCLVDGDLRIWDSLAICEYVNEKFPEKHLWPADAAARALARSITAEMHSGFAAMRDEMSMKVLEQYPASPKRPETQKDIERVMAIWADCRARFAARGPFLFGEFSIADAFYAPVVTRFRTYAVPAEGAVRAYTETIWSLPAMQQWVAGARAETLRAIRHE